MGNIDKNFNEENMSIVIVGHVDHGKSTIIGRLLADTNSLPSGKLEQVKENCRRNSKPFEYAFLLDALKDEQAQGITIDAARIFFNTSLRKYIILDAPGHIEFLKNMVTGASRAEAALLVIDANEGVMENSRRHGYLLSMLGIKQVSVLVNKMDLVDYSKERFDSIVEEYSQFLEKLGVVANSYIPISGFYGDNIANTSSNLSWYEGDTVLQTLDSFNNSKVETNQVFRMPVQGVYKFTRSGDNRRIVAGTIDSGVVSEGDEVIFYPSGKKSQVKSIEYFNGDPRKQASAGEAAGFTLEEQIYITRGELACLTNETKPKVTTRIETKIFWLGKNDLVEGGEYSLKIGTQKVKAVLEKVSRVLDASNLNNKVDNRVKRHEVAEVIFNCDEEVAFDLSTDISETSRFVIIDNYEIAGGGIITKALKDDASWVRKQRMLRDEKWLKSGVSRQDREKLYGHKPALIVVSGEKDTGRKTFARYLEKRLYLENKHAYFLPINNIVYSIASDLNKEYAPSKAEYIRRLAETANMLLDSGQIVITTAQLIDDLDLIAIEEIVNKGQVLLVNKENNLQDLSRLSDIVISKLDI